MRHAINYLSTLRKCKLHLIHHQRCNYILWEFQSLNKGSDCTADHHAGMMPLAEKE